MATVIRSRFRHLRLLAVLACVIAGMVGSRAAIAQLPEFRGDSLEGAATPRLEPKRPRTEQDLDRLHAAAMYAHGRMLLQRDDAAGALGRFERSYRYDPQAAHIAREIVTLASRLKRYSEAARYAVLSAERQANDPRLLRQLGEMLVGQGQLDRAAAIYAQALALMQPQGNPDPTSVLLRAELGRLYLVTEKFDQAAAMLSVLRDALARPDDFGFMGPAKSRLIAEAPRLYPLIAESYYRVQRWDDASTMFRRAYEDQAQKPLLAFQLARVAVAKQDWTSARRQLDQYFATKSAVAGSQPYDLLDRLIAGERNRSPAGDSPKELLAELTRLHDQDPENVPLGYFLAGKLVEAGQTERATSLYASLVDRQATSDGIQALAGLYHQQKNTGALLKLLGSIVEQEGSRGSLGPVAATIAGDAAALEQLTDAVKTGTPGYASCVGVAMLAIHAHKPDLAAELYERALATPQAPQVKIDETIGLGALIGEQPALAARAFQHAIDAGLPAEKLAAYYFYLAGAREFAGDTAGALKAAEKCASLSPGSPQFQSRPAWVLYHAKRWPEAEKRYREVLDQFDPQFVNDDVRDQVRQARMILSNTCVMLNRLPEAEEWLEQVLDEFPEDVGAYNDLGYLWVDQNKHLHRALAMCERAVESEPENGAYRDSLGWAYFRLGRFAEAVDELEKAADLTPDGVIFDHLGDAYLGARNVEKAVVAWGRAVESFDKDSEFDKSQRIAAKIEQHRSK